MEFDVENSGLWGLFLSAFISSTLLPGGSEIILAYLVNLGVHSDALLLLIATTGNTLGALTTWLIGLLISKQFLAKKELTQLQQNSLHHLQMCGSPVLLLSWLPVVGDGLCLAAGLLRIPLPLALLFIATGKGFRYLVVILLSG